MSEIKIFVKGGGGLGDLIREYLEGEKYWGYLEGIKEKYPGIKIKAILCIHNPQAKEFLKYHPCLDSTEQYPWQVDGTPVFFTHSDEHVFIKSVPGLFEGLKYRKPPIYLDKKEEIQVETIKNAGKYIVIHPFAGLKDRIVFPIEGYPALIDGIIDTGYNVVVIGGSYTRINRDGQEEVNEFLEYTRKGLYNLVGNSNARVATRLIQGASGFIGTHSCYILVASIEMIKSVLVVPEKLRVYLNSNDANAKIVRHNFIRTIYINNKMTFNELSQEIIKWLKSLH